MTRIISFEIEGLYGRMPSISVDLNEDLNVLFGSNGVGKTSILRILDSALAGDCDRIADIKFSHATVEICLDSSNDPLVLKCDRNKSSRSRHDGVIRIEIQGESDRVFEDIPYLIRKSLKKEMSNPEWELLTSSGKKIRKPMRRLSYAEFLTVTRLYEANGRAAFGPDFFSERSRVLEKSFSSNIQKTWSLRFGKISSKVNEIQHKSLVDILSDSLLNKGDDRNFINVDNNKFGIDTTYSLVKSFLNKGVSNDAPSQKEDFIAKYESSNDIQNIVAKIAHAQDGIDKIRKPLDSLSELIELIFSNETKLVFDGPEIKASTKNGDDIPIECLSSGEKHIVKILISAMSIGDGVLLIDEPEISLHIEWQRNLLSWIRSINPHCQVICATHAPEIMAEIEDEKVFHI